MSTLTVVNGVLFLVAATACGVGTLTAYLCVIRDGKRRGRWGMLVFAAGVLGYICIIDILMALMTFGILPELYVLRSGIMNALGTTMGATVITVLIIGGEYGEH